MGETRVDLQHLLEDLRDAYTGALEETILTEVVANALDSGAARIRMTTNPANATLTIDLEKQEIRGPDGGVIHFEIDPFRKHCLLNGLDDIGLTMQKKASIDSFEAKEKTAWPWL